MRYILLPDPSGPKVITATGQRIAVRAVVSDTAKISTPHPVVTALDGIADFAPAPPPVIAPS